MKRILKLALPPVLAVMLIVGYGSGTIEAMARTVASWVTTVTMTETDGPTKIVEKTYVGAGGAAPSGEEWKIVDAGSDWDEYERSVLTVTAINTDVTTQVLTEVTVPDEPQVSDKVVRRRNLWRSEVRNRRRRNLGRSEVRNRRSRRLRKTIISFSMIQ